MAQLQASGGAGATLARGVILVVIVGVIGGVIRSVIRDTGGFPVSGLLCG